MPWVTRGKARLQEAPTGSRPYRGLAFRGRLDNTDSPAECHSAIRQVANLRYGALLRTLLNVVRISSTVPMARCRSYSKTLPGVIANCVSGAK